MRKFPRWFCWKSTAQRHEKRKAPAFPDQHGLTAIVGRPLIGKTWTLTEVGRRLAQDGEFLIGYHEATGPEPSHLLHAISDLYTRWLADSSLWAQARSLSERHKDSMVPKVGQAVGGLFEKLHKLGEWVPESVIELVRDAFDGLAAAQKDVLTAGVQLAPLDYEQARDLARLVALLSKKRVVIILDAWGKSSSARFERQTLEAYLNHLDDWPGAHVFLGIRHPELDPGGSEDEAFTGAQDLANRTPAAQIYELPLMQLEATERQHMIVRVRERVPAAREVTDQDLLDMIDGFPGVLSLATGWMRRTERRCGFARTCTKRPPTLNNIATGSSTGYCTL